MFVSAPPQPGFYPGGFPGQPPYPQQQGYPPQQPGYPGQGGFPPPPYGGGGFVPPPTFGHLPPPTDMYSGGGSNIEDGYRGADHGLQFSDKTIKLAFIR